MTSSWRSKRLGQLRFKAKRNIASVRRKQKYYASKAFSSQEAKDYYIEERTQEFINRFRDLLHHVDMAEKRIQTHKKAKEKAKRKEGISKCMLTVPATKQTENARYGKMRPGDCSYYFDPFSQEYKEEGCCLVEGTPALKKPGTKVEGECHDPHTLAAYYNNLFDSARRNKIVSSVGAPDRVVRVDDPYRTPQGKDIDVHNAVYSCKRLKQFLVKEHPEVRKVMH